MKMRMRILLWMLHLRAYFKAHLDNALSMTRADWITLIANELIHITFIAMFITAIGVHIDTGEYDQQCRWMIKMNDYAQNRHMNSILNLSPPVKEPLRLQDIRWSYFTKANAHDMPHDWRINLTV